MNKNVKRREIIVSLWIFLSLNYILCDLFSNMEQSVIQGLLRGEIAGMAVTEGFLLLAAFSLEIPFMMIVANRLFSRKILKPINVIAGILMIVYQVGSFSMGGGSTMHYIFFSVIEIIANIAIVYLAWKWQADDV